MMNKVAGVLLLLAAVPCAFFGYLEGGGMHSFDEFKFRVDDEPFAIVLLLGAAVCFAGGLTALVKNRQVT